MEHRGNATGSGLLAGLLVVLAPLCCLGLPLLLAAGVSAGVAAALGGGIAGGLAVALGVSVLVVRAPRRRKEACRASAAGAQSSPRRGLQSQQ